MLDEIRDEIAGLPPTQNQEIGNPEGASARGDVDILQLGFIACEGDSLQITEDGRSFLRRLEIEAQAPRDFAPSSQSLTAIDDLIGSDTRLKIFDLELRSTDQSAQRAGGEDETIEPGPLPRDAADKFGAADDDAADKVGPADDDNIGAGNGAETQQRGGAEVASDAPAFLIRKFGSGMQDSSARSNLLAMLAGPVRRGTSAWRRHVLQDQPKEVPRSGAKLEPALFALLALLVVASGAGAVAAFMQAKSLKSELASVQHDMLALKERIARLDELEKSKEIPAKANDQKSQPPRERPEDVPLILSREEIQVVRGFIKPAPVAGASAVPASIGDPVAGPTIPFPSAVTEKVPKLLGARFAIKNGAIVIVRRDSRQVDAVLGPN